MSGFGHLERRLRWTCDGFIVALKVLHRTSGGRVISGGFIEWEEYNTGKRNTAPR